MNTYIIYIYILLKTLILSLNNDQVACNKRFIKDYYPCEHKGSVIYIKTSMVNERLLIDYSTSMQLEDGNVDNNYLKTDTSKF